MEGGALLSDEFKSFAQDYVPFLHITTQIEGRKHDGLFGEKGGRGFPSFFMMDASGNVLGRQVGPAEVSRFQEMGAGANEYFALVKKAEAGDVEAQVAVGVRRAEFGQLTKTELEAFLAKHEAKLTDDQKSSLKSALANLMVDDIMTNVVGGRFLEMHEKGLIPTEQQAARSFYLTLTDFGEKTDNVAALEAGVAGIEELFGSNPNARGFIDMKKKALAELKAKQAE